ncbi:alpha-ribazole-5-phosphate synthase [Planomicrobium sp. Y74]|uniref:alpha-ribazole-5-phosphate synthase n=1 Tax=Planomicrobium sp. Y74 TaxID=2478977 RepID=UPI000EF4D6A1|nr:alpha-ribazole-5-phosphate synthase [Planomicrobium sp. Y74]RLQ90547.1 alpha-ribazole-5-phosphate synthase [Planomicrobium sp. Y74]
MRHELIIDDLVVTTDNSAAIGEKEFDEIKSPDRIVAKFSARVALLEQWAAGSEPLALLLHNFSGAGQWDEYVSGIEELFREAGLQPIPIKGSSETNISTLQSGISVTILGKKSREVSYINLTWFVYGLPLTGRDVMDKPGDVADMKLLNQLLKEEIIEALWPVGSKGIEAEIEAMAGKPVTPIAGLDLQASGGPSTAVLIGVSHEKNELLKKYKVEPLFPLSFID